MSKRKPIVIYNVGETWPSKVYEQIDDKIFHVMKISFEERFEDCHEGVTMAPQWLMKNYVIMNQKDIINREIQTDDDVVLLLTDTSPYLETYNSFRALNEGKRFHLHIIIICNLDNRLSADEGLVRVLPYYFEADSICIINVNALLHDETAFYSMSYGSMSAVYFDEQVYEAWSVGAEQMMAVLNMQDFSMLHSDAQHLWLYDADTGVYALHSVNQTVALNAVRDQCCLYEVITPTANPRTLCVKLKKMRYAFAQAHHYGYSEKKCHHEGPCAGTCQYCEHQAVRLFQRAQKQASNINDSEQWSKVAARINGIMRFRQNIDGPGMRSLVAFDECLLDCKYCINKENIHLLPCNMTTTASELGRELEKDFIYYDVSGGGVTFGGGEPLLNHDFIEAFHHLYPQVDIAVETSLNVESWRLNGLIDVVSHWIVDIKDMNPGVYLAYTGSNNERVVSNLKMLALLGVSDRVICRVPHIEGYNTDDDVCYSKEMLHQMGFHHIDELTYQVVE